MAKSILVKRTFRPGSRPPDNKRQEHVMLLGGREGPGAVDLPIRTDWDGTPSERLTALLSSDQRSKRTPTQSPYLLRVRPELRGWQTGISTVAEMESASLPLAMNPDLLSTDLNVALFPPPHIELTFLTTEEFISAGDTRPMVSREIQLTAVPIITRLEYSRFVADLLINQVTDPSTRRALMSLYPTAADGSRQIQVTEQAFDILGLPWNRVQRRPITDADRVTTLKNSQWYQKFVGVLGKVAGNDSPLFFPYSLIARLRQVYPERPGYPPVVSARPTPSFSNKTGLDVDFMSRRGPDVYTLVTTEKITPEEAILRLRRGR